MPTRSHRSRSRPRSPTSPPPREETPMRRLITIITVAGLVLAAGSSGAVAASKPPLISIGVAPSKLQANLYPGQLYKTDLDIYNKGGGPVVLDVYLQDYTISAD